MTFRELLTRRNVRRVLWLWCFAYFVSVAPALAQSQEPAAPASGSQTTNGDLDAVVSLIGDLQQTLMLKIDSMTTQAQASALSKQLAEHDAKMDAKFEEARGWVAAAKDWRTYVIGIGAAGLAKYLTDMNKEPK